MDTERLRQKYARLEQATDAVLEYLKASPWSAAAIVLGLVAAVAFVLWV